MGRGTEISRVAKLIWVMRRLKGHLRWTRVVVVVVVVVDVLLLFAMLLEQLALPDLLVDQIH